MLIELWVSGELAVSDDEDGFEVIKLSHIDFEM